MALERMASLFRSALVFSVVMICCLRSPAHADPYFNSSEPGCDGTDPNVLWCDDFERGSWYSTADDINNPSNDGWNGSPFGGPDPLGKNFGRCGGVSAGFPTSGAAGTNCAVTSGPQGATQALAMADHNLLQQTTVTEIYVRYYYYPLARFQWGQEKSLTVNPFAGSGGIFFGTLFMSAGTSIAPYFYAINMNGGTNLFQNQGNDLSITGGYWYYIELHLKLETPGQSNGVVEMWLDNCGANGTGCSGPGTLRLQYANVILRPDSTTQIGAVWFENWANPVSVGEQYYDQIKVSRVRVGPMPPRIAPGAPTNVKLQ